MKKNNLLLGSIFLCFFAAMNLYAVPNDKVFENQYKPISDYAKNKAARESGTFQSGMQSSALPEISVIENLCSKDGGPFLFQFKYDEGDKYRILSTVKEDVLINRKLHHKADIVNRVTAQVTDVDENGRGLHQCTFMTSEKSVAQYGGSYSKPFEYGEEYESIFWRDKRGRYEIGKEFFMPTVRDVPHFPAEAVYPGQIWTSRGHEAHDLRQGFGIKDPYIVPFEATYTYLGTKDGFHVIRVRYTLLMESPKVSQEGEYPESTMGFSDEVIFWDGEKGAIDHYIESFRIVIQTNLGNSFEFKGTARAEVTDYEKTSTRENAEAVAQQVQEMGLENITVTETELGLTVSFEDIKFLPDSAVLQDSERKKIEAVAMILMKYPNDILVSGHTALAGTEKVRQKLSLERAQTVASYLVSLGVRKESQVFVKGFGATKPVADNNTESGKARNRRVEITLLDK